LNKQNLISNLEKLRKSIRKEQVIPCEVSKILNEREIIIKVKGLFILAYTNLNLETGGQLYLKIEQVQPQLRFKLITIDEYNFLSKNGIDYII